MNNGLLPNYLGRNLTYVGVKQQYPLRNNNNFTIQRVNKASTWNSILNKGVQLFNKIPYEIKDTVNIKDFKRRLNKYVKDNY